MFAATKLHKESVSHKLNVLAHEMCIHTNETHREGICQELLLDDDSFTDNLNDVLIAWMVNKMLEKEAGKIIVKTFITGDELIGEGKTWHETMLLEPEDGSK